jgi:hypothetical protein
MCVNGGIVMVTAYASVVTRLLPLLSPPTPPPFPTTSIALPPR